MGIIYETKNKTFDIKPTEEELNNTAKEMIRGFMDNYIDDIISESDIWSISHEDFGDRCELCGEPTIVDMTVEYVTYNNGVHVDTKLHGEPIILKVEQVCPKCSKEN